MSEVIYEPHPVSPERKAELRKQGYKIIDAQFAPDGYEHPDAGKKTARPSKGQSIDQIKAKLTEKGIQFEPDADRGALAKLLDEAE